MKKFKNITKLIFGLLLLIIQIVIEYFDRFIIAIIPWLSIDRITTKPKKITNSIIRVLVCTIIYLIL